MRTHSLVLISFSCMAMLFFLHASIRAMKQKSDNLFNLTLNAEDIPKLFPTTASELETRVNAAIEDARTEINKIIAIPTDERTFENTVRAFDSLCSYSNLGIMGGVVNTLKKVSPDDELRNKAEETFLMINNFAVEEISSNVDLYKALKVCYDNNLVSEAISKEERRALDKIIQSFEREGINLPESTIQEVGNLKKEISDLKQQLIANIANDMRTITVNEQELDGLSEEFINNLKRTDDGLCIVGVDMPTFSRVIEQCTVENTRKKIYKLFRNRAYPINDKVIQELLAKRQQLAKLLGFNTYAEYELAPTMAQSPETVRLFVKDLITHTQPKEATEFKTLVKACGTDICIPETGRMEPWNEPYYANYYKKTFYNIDEQEIANYFPMEKTIDNMLKIYETFFNIHFSQIPCTRLWHKDVQLIAVDDTATNTRLGYILLDLHPRPNKFSHGCKSTIVPAIAQKENKPNLDIIIANFPQSTSGAPSLMKLSEVKIFFHEFGHALHSVFSRTKLAASTNVVFDFVETPSKLFEEWLMDKDILHMLSSHYETGDSLPEELIDRIIACKNVNSGTFLQRQCFLTLFSLDCYDNKETINLDEIEQALRKELFTHTAYYDDEHFYTSFMHLGQYASRYYTYLWSEAMAHDLANKIKESGGFLNPTIGCKLKEMLLSKGDSEDPTVLMEQFLERKPSNKAFLKNYGLLL